MKTLLTVSLVLLAAVLVLLLADIIPMLRRWLSRIHIGQWEDEEEWKTQVEKSLLKQLRHAPSVPVSDNTRLTFIERLRGTYTSKNIQSWQEAALLLGANEMHKQKAVDGQIKEFIGRRINPVSGEWQDCHEKVDTAMLAFAILSSPVSDKQKIKPAMDSTAKMLLDLAERYATIPYNNSVPNVRFVDTVGMICPFLFKYGLAYDCERAIETAKRQITESIDWGIHPVQKLPAHCFNVHSRAPLGIYGWGRGCGWLAIGLMDSYLSLLTAKNSNAMNTNNHNELKDYLMEQMTSVAWALIRVQMDNGAWGRQIFINEAGESSATAMIAWFMGRMCYLADNEQYKKSADKGRNFLLESTRRNGTVDFAQGDTKGIGFYSTKLDAMPAAQGFTVRCFLGRENDGR